MTNYAMAYFQKELEESSQYLVTPQERENMVALVYRANPGDLNTRLVQLKAQKCSCLAFQVHVDMRLLSVGFQCQTRELYRQVLRDI